MSENFDVVVIGAGPGGYIAAIRAAQLGLSVACVEKDATLGGTCLNVGCIPSKALLHASEVYDHTGHGTAELGVKVTGVSLDLAAMQGFKTKVVDSNTAGIAFLFKKNKVTHLRGLGTIKAAGVVQVTDTDGKTRDVGAKKIVIATGSVPSSLPGVEIDEKRILSSTGALALPEVPKHLVVIGAGVIGLELGSVWRRLGAEVTVVEYLDRITPGMDLEVTKAFEKSLTKQGLKFKLSSKVTSVTSDKKGAKVTFEPVAGGDAQTLEADYVLVAVGRKPLTTGLGLEAAGIKTDKRGMVEVDDHFETNVKGIYAIGDVIRGPMLAHKAEEEGVAVAELIAGQKPHVNYGVIPGVVYTMPEVASVGKTEEELKDAGVKYNVGKFPFMANGRAKANANTEGFVKILADAKTDRVLGVHILGAVAGTMIAEAALAMEFGASAEDIALTCHAHPTHPEALKEAALAVHKRTLNM
ncbi:dihydrolipoyl dehydrogenase [Govanella unica]|uniref:Dihydrolipoyl dehydrogenase n=1 Tax=Govanella unica TaxID=2975056 RepID=A0A9X3TW15_9PROT|nr:dihydrolipoyl dehydrogenase [Govania unica]MDA5192746.1 dihydrolipoyl dehydrogenase [Govania unica]